MSPVHTVRKVLIGTDGSADAAIGLELAADLCLQLGAEALVVHAVGLLEHGPDDGAVRVSRDEVEDDLRTRWCRPLADRSVAHRCVVDDGPPLLVIPRIAEREDVDLVVVASHGRGNAQAMPLGSTSHGLVQLGQFPVLVVPTRGAQD